MEGSSQTLEGRKETNSPKLIILAPEILFLVASFASQPTLTALARTSKMMLEESRKLLYRNIVIEDESACLLFFTAFDYPPVRAPITDEHDSPDPDELILPGEDDRARMTKRIRAFDEDPDTMITPTRPPSVTDYIGTLTLLVPPPSGFRTLLRDRHPHLSRQPYQPPRLFRSSFLPIPLDKLIIHSRQRDYEAFSFLCGLLHPTHFQIVSLDRRARTWHSHSVVIPSSWVLLDTIVMENCMVVRPEMGDMNPTISIPYQQCNSLRRIRIELTKEDQPEPNDDGEDIWEEENERIGVLDSIWYNVPFLGHGEFAKLETFEVAVRGEERLEGLKRWMVERKDVLMDQWMDPERWERWFRLELLEREVEVLPWREGDSEKEEGSDEAESESEEESEKEQSEEEEEEEEESGEDGTASEEGSEKEEAAPGVQVDSSWF